MTAQDTQDQAMNYDAAALALAVKLREFVYKHGTKHGLGAVDALAAPLLLAVAEGRQRVDGAVAVLGAVLVDELAQLDRKR
jgi:hypothetical protein